jgi:hypothetical protein
MRISKALVAGFGYGFILACLSFMLMGFGHGTYVPFAISSAPLAMIDYLTGTIFIGLFGAPVLWALIADLVAKKFHRPFLITMALHYAGVTFSLVRPIDDDWSYFLRMMRFSGGTVILWIVAYVLGQAILWHRYAETR